MIMDILFLYCTFGKTTKRKSQAENHEKLVTPKKSTVPELKWQFILCSTNFQKVFIIANVFPCGIFRSHGAENRGDDRVRVVFPDNICDFV